MECLCYARYSVPGNTDSRVMRTRPKLAFRWKITIDDESHQCDVSVRADHASERGVPFPVVWMKVDAMAREACRRAREELSLPDVTQLHCRPTCAQFTCAFSYTCLNFTRVDIFLYVQTVLYIFMIGTLGLLMLPRICIVRPSSPSVGRSRLMTRATSAMFP